MTTAPTFVHHQQSRILCSQRDHPWKRFCLYSLPISFISRRRGLASCVYVCVFVRESGFMWISSFAIPAPVTNASRVPNDDNRSACQVLLWCGICSLTGGWDVTFSFKASLLLGHGSACAASLWHPLVSLHQGVIRLKTVRMCTSCEKVSVKSHLFLLCAHGFARLRRHDL